MIMELTEANSSPDVCAVAAAEFLCRVGMERLTDGQGIRDGLVAAPCDRRTAAKTIHTDAGDD